MAVALRSSAVSSALSNTGGTTSISVGSAEKGRVLTVGLITRDYDLVLPTITDIDCGGEAMTLWSSNDRSAHDYHRVYYLNPPSTTGVQTVSVTFSDITSWAMLVMMWTGADPANPLAASVKANAADTNPITSVYVPRQSALFTLLEVEYSGTRPTVVADSGQLKLTEQNVSFDVSNNFLGIGARVVGGGGGSPFSDSWTLQFAETWRMQSVVVNEKQMGQPMTGRP